MRNSNLTPTNRSASLGMLVVQRFRQYLRSVRRALANAPTDPAARASLALFEKSVDDLETVLLDPQRSISEVGEAQHRAMQTRTMLAEQHRAVGNRLAADAERASGRTAAARWMRVAEVLDPHANPHDASAALARGAAALFASYPRLVDAEPSCATRLMLHTLLELQAAWEVQGTGSTAAFSATIHDCLDPQSAQLVLNLFTQAGHVARARSRSAI